MKNLEISAYGVEEMKSQEMKSVDGGIIFTISLTAGLWILGGIFGAGALHHGGKGIVNWFRRRRGR